jgi:hypothetical protein
MTDTAAEIPPAVRMQQLLSGFEVSQALYVIAELGVATVLLDGPRSVREVALAAGADPDALGRIIRFLASLGVFQTDGETVTVTDLGRTLADGPPDSVRGTDGGFTLDRIVPGSAAFSAIEATLN